MGDDRPLSQSPGPRAAALDYGRARVGLAVADELGILAHPRPFIPAVPPARCLRDIARFVKEENVSLLLLGLPTNMDGSEGPSARRVRKFAEALATASGVPIAFIDERLSTVQAQARLHEAGRTEKTSKGRIDSASAAVLLQSWLDGKRRARER